MKRLGLVAALIAAGALLSLPSELGAQVVNATISGTVKDASGAVVPNVKVTITNRDTNAAREVMSNASGDYTVTGLPVGTYTVSATAKGFKTDVHNSIDLHVGDQKVVDLNLQPGETVTTVEVTGGATLVQTRTGTSSSLITPIQMSELPLNGRNFLQLALLVPGASAGDAVDTRNVGLLSGSDISMSGNQANTNAWLLDGADNVDEGSGRTLLIYPSVDAIQEFKVQRNAMGAENPSAGGAVISVVSKSGTNAFHGSAYDFVRNTVFNANYFFLNEAGAPKAKLRYNDFGYTFGGPIKKDKAFFFWSEEWRREIRGIPRMTTVPTDAERTGNFNPTPRIGCDGGAANCLTAGTSVPIDPYTGVAFPGNMIPGCAAGQTTDCLSPAGLAILKLYPEPTNSKTSFNWVQGVNSGIPWREDSIRGDYNINDRTTFSIHFANDQWNNPAPNAGSENGLWGDTGYPTVDSNWAQPSKSLAAHLTQTFGASKVNDITFTYSNNRIFITQGIGKNINDAINAAIPTVFPHSGDYSHAIFWGAPPASASLWNEAPWQNGEDLFTWKDDFNWTKGNHVFKFGGLYNHDTKTEPIFGASQVAPQFWGPTAVPGGAGVGGGWGPSTAPGNGNNVTGNGTADLLLQGTYWGESGEASAEPVSFIAWHDLEMYAADTWRITPRLTLDYGLRWNYLPPTYQRDDHMGNFIPSLYDPALGATPTNGMIYAPGYVNTAAGITGGSANLRGINVGRALRHTGWLTFGPRFGFAWDPTGAALWSIRGGVGIFNGRADQSSPDDGLASNPPFSSSANCDNGRPLDSLGPASLCAAALGTPISAADTNWKVQGSYQWNFTVERQLNKDTKLEASYVGNRGVHLPIDFNLNQTPLADFVQYRTLAFTPGNNSAQFLLQPLNALKSGNSLPYQTGGGNSSYNAFQLYVTRRFSRGYTFGASYAWSQTLSDTTQTCCAGTTLPINELPNYNRGLSNFDRTHILSLNWIYDIPTFNNHGRAFRDVLGSWETTGVYTYDSGLPLFVTGQIGNCPASACRPDIVGTAAPHTPNQWFSASDYMTPSMLGDIGNSAPANLRGPGIDNFDLAIYKNFPLRWEKTSLQFRFETFNSFNHTQLLAVDTNYAGSNICLANGNSCITSGSDISSSSRIGCIVGGLYTQDCNTNPTFGKALNTRHPRELQLAMKFLF
jgi:carboxypeptidase family protein